MAKHHMPESHANHPNVVPMIDIIMCLIIFYMLIAKIGVKTGEDESITIPNLNLIGKELKARNNTLLVNVRQSNRITQIKPFVADAPQAEEITFTPGSNPDFTQWLQALVSGKDKKFGTSDDNKDLKLIIRGDNFMPYSALQDVLIPASAANISSLNFQITNKPEEP